MSNYLGFTSEPFPGVNHNELTGKVFDAFVDAMLKLMSQKIEL